MYIVTADLSRQLVDAVQEFFENNMMPILGINNILVVGGGAESSEEKGIDPISMYIMSHPVPTDIYTPHAPCS